MTTAPEPQKGEKPRRRAAARRAAQQSPSHIALLAPPTSQPFVPTHEQIARRAYEIWLERGCEHGHDTEHWLEAERQLRQQAAR